MTVESPAPSALPALLSSNIPPADVVHASPVVVVRGSPDPAPVPDRRSPSPTSRRGRPRVLDDAKRLEISALVAGGCSLREAAKIVGCGLNTIQRELERNPRFSKSVRRSQMRAQLSPLRAMQRAAGKHWRAAAWLLERAYPERFARRDSATESARQARRLLNEVINIIRQEINDPYLQARLVKRLKPAFDDSIRAARASRRTSSELRQAIAFFDSREKPPCVGGVSDADSATTKTASPELRGAGARETGQSCSLTSILCRLQLTNCPTNMRIPANLRILERETRFHRAHTPYSTAQPSIATRLTPAGLPTAKSQ